MSDLDAGVTEAAIGRANDVTRRAVGARWAAAGDDAGGPVRLGTTELAQVKLDGRPAGAPVVAYLGPGAAPSSGEAVALRPTTDRAPQAWRILGRAPVAVGSESVLRVNSYVYGPYSVQQEGGAGLASGEYGSPFPSEVRSLGTTMLGYGGPFAWGRLVAEVDVTHNDTNPTHNPIIVTVEYRIVNGQWPTGSPAFAAASAIAPVNGSLTRQRPDKDDITAASWYRTDGISGSPNTPWMAPGSTGSLIFEVWYRAQHYGSFAVRIFWQGSIRRGSITQGVGPTRANRFVSIPGYPP